MTSPFRGDPGRALLLAEEYRDALLARDRAMLRRQARALLLVLSRLDERILALSNTLAARRAAGQPTSPGTVVRLAEYRALREQAQAELERYATARTREITALQETNIEAAIEETRGLVSARLPRSVTWRRLEALGVEWSNLDPSALEFMVGRMGDGSPLRAYLAARVVRGTISQVADTLTAGVLDNPRVTARALRRHFAGGMTQALRISRTETLRVYRDAARASYQENPRLVRAYRRHEALDNRTCAACWMLDGVLYDLASDMEEHVQGRGYLVPELVPWRELGFPEIPDDPPPETGRERFERLSEERQREIIGNDRQYELLRSGRIGLADLIQRRVHPDFGAQLTQASARASLAGRATLSALPSTDVVTPLAGLVRPFFELEP